MAKWSYKQFLKEIRNNEVSEGLASNLIRMARATFEWEGVEKLSPLCESRLIEKYLFEERKCAIVETNELGWIVCRILPRGLNINNEPAGYDMIVLNGTKVTPVKAHKGLGQIGKDNAIILFDSESRANGRIDGLSILVQDYALTQRVIRQQITNQFTPMIGFSSANGKDSLSIKQIIIDKNLGTEALVVDESMRDVMQMLNLNAPLNVEILNKMQNEFKARAYSYLGIDSLQSFGKKERLVVDEAESNDESLGMILADCLRSRKKSIEAGTDILGENKLSVKVSDAVRIQAESDYLSDSNYRRNVVE